MDVTAIFLPALCGLKTDVAIYYIQSCNRDSLREFYVTERTLRLVLEYQTQILSAEPPGSHTQHSVKEYLNPIR